MRLNVSDIVQLDGNNSNISLSSDSCQNSSLTNAQITIDTSESSDMNSNNTCCDSTSTEVSEASIPDFSPQPIPVVAGSYCPDNQPSPPAWHESYSPRPPDLPAFRKTIRRDNRLLTGASLPVFSAPNCRSIFPKLKNIIEDMRMRRISCILAS